MPLPPPESRIYWKDYEIDTPTFQLTPVEKPDMSPFLVHMTGKNQIISILQSNNAPNQIHDGHGYLMANVPEHASEGFDARVVCFTESPTFALDFFRYRSFKRWKADQRFGIGFDKATLVSRGVRPAIYAGDQLTKTIIFLNRRYRDKGNCITDDDKLNVSLIEMLQATYPLLFPLLEDTPQQGFMWEREWRHPSPDGFSFSHRDIQIICCPENEEEEIRQILGEVAEDIEFIRAWQEYDDVTDYLRRQEPIWREKSETIQQSPNQKEKIQQLRDLIQQYHIAENSLDSYQSVISQLSEYQKRINDEKEKLREQISALQAELNRMEEEKES